MVQVIDPKVEAKLKAGRTAIEARRLAINHLEDQAREHKQELKKIRLAASQFGVFLKRNSIAPYNDAMVAYLDEQIKEERNLVAFSQAIGDPVPENVKRLEDLEKSKGEYEARIQVLEEKMRGSDDAVMVNEQTIDAMVSMLYSLPVWGRRLQQMREALEWSKSENFREQQFRPKVNKNVLAFLQPSTNGSGAAKSIQRVGTAVTSAFSTGLSVIRGVFSGGMASRGRKRDHGPVQPEGYQTRAKVRRTSGGDSESQT